MTLHCEAFQPIYSIEYFGLLHLSVECKVKQRPQAAHAVFPMRSLAVLIKSWTATMAAPYSVEATTFVFTPQSFRMKESPKLR